MAAVRVTGVTTGLSVSGTLYAKLGGVSPVTSSHFEHSDFPTGFASTAVSIPSASVGIGIGTTVRIEHFLGGVNMWEGISPTYRQLDPSDPLYQEVLGAIGAPYGYTWVWQVVVTAAVSWGDMPEGGSGKNHYVAFNAGDHYYEANGEGWLGEQELSLSYSLSLSGYTLKRSCLGSIPTARTHMHLTDAYVKDTWVQTPDAAATASIDGLSVTGYRRDAYPPGTSDADIGDYGVTTPSVSYGMAVSGPTQSGVDVCSFSASGSNFDGLNHTACASGGAADTILAVGGGSTATLHVVTGGWKTASWTGLQFISHSYSWYPEFELWEGETLDPDLWAGYYSWKIMEATEGAITYQYWAIDEALMYKASELPTYEPPWQGWDGLGIGTPGRTPSPRNWNFRFSATIDEFWALDNWLCPQRVNYEGGEEEPFLIETMQDRYVPVHVPGVDGGVSAPYEKGLITVTGREPSLFPLAENKDAPLDDPLDRLQQLGTLASYKDLTQEPDYPPPSGDRDGAQLAWYVPEKPVYLDWDGETVMPGPYPTGGLSLNVQTRYWERLALLPDPYEYVPKNWRWYWYLRHNAAGEGLASDPPDPREPAYGEDLFSWHGCSWLKISLVKPKSAAMTLTLTVTYQEQPSITDPHYTCGSWRAEEFEYTTPSVQTVTYTIPVAGAPGQPGSYDLEYIPVPGGQALKKPVKVYETAELVVDLLRPDEMTVPDLWVVNSWKIEGLTIPFDEYRDPINETLVAQGGYLEIADMVLCRDQGYDHTGRDVRESGEHGSLAGMKCGESWDFQGDWAFQWAYRDGYPRCLKIPDDPYRNNGPEDGLGCIEPLRHCPTYSGPAGQMDYARPIDTAQMLTLHESFDAPLDLDAVYAMTRSYWKGPDDPEDIGYPSQYWLTGRMHTAGDDSYTMTAAIVCSAWHIPGGTGGSVIHLRKTMGGSAWCLLLTEDGRRYTSNDLAELEEPLGEAFNPTLVVWKKVTYVDEDDEAIAWPGGELPEPDIWLLYKTAVPLLDRHGLLRFPGLHPSDTRINNPGKSQVDATLQTDHGKTTYYAQLWVTGDWSGYDINDAEQLAEMLALPGCLGEFPEFGGVAPRMVVDLPSIYITPPLISENTRLDAVATDFGTILVGHHSSLYWPAQGEAQFDDVLQLDLYSPEADDPNSPLSMTQMGAYLDPALVGKAHNAVPLGSTNLAFVLAQVNDRDRDTVAFKVRVDGGAASSASTDVIEGYRYLSACRGPQFSDVLVAARNETTQQVDVLRFRQTVPAEGGGGTTWDGTWEWQVLSRSVGSCDEMSPAIVATTAGPVVVFSTAGDSLYARVSRDYFSTKASLETLPGGYTHPAATQRHNTQSLLVLLRNTEGAAELWRFSQEDAGSDNVWYQLCADFGTMDEVTGSVLSLPTGQDLVFLVRDDTIRCYSSTDNWRTVTQVTTG